MTREYKNRLVEQGCFHFLEPIMMDSSTSYKVKLSHVGGDTRNYANVKDDSNHPVKDEPAYQYELGLEYPHEYIEKLQDAIERFDRAYQRLHTYFHRWESLMNSVELNEDIAELYENIVLLRKLKGEEIR